LLLLLLPICAGIADLLRVLSQRASEVLRAEDEEEDDGMEVEQSEGDGDESSGSEDDSSELDEEQQQSLKVSEHCSSKVLVFLVWSKVPWTKVPWSCARGCWDPQGTGNMQNRDSR
jgi:hypothetical protein